jgi:hypothetical protein
VFQVRRGGGRILVSLNAVRLMGRGGILFVLEGAEGDVNYMCFTLRIFMDLAWKCLCCSSIDLYMWC